MNQAMAKNLIREIKGSFSRFIAIFAIIALGAGFLIGLKMSRPDFIETLDQYLHETNFYNFRLVSTLGLTEDDVKEVQKLSGVTDAEGAIAADFLCAGEDDDNLVISACSIPEKINTLELTAGKMPEKPNECLADPEMFSESDIGTIIKLSNDNSEDTFNTFAYKEYTIVGLSRSVSYINIERGSSTIGNGNVAGYIYIPLGGFALDCYTDIYVTVEGDGYVYSDEYKNAMKPYEAPLKAFMEERALIRYESIIGDAENQLSDAREQYEAGLKEYEPARKEYEEGRAAFDKQKADAMSELNEAGSKLSEAEKMLADPSALDAKEKELKAAQKEIDAGYSEYKSNAAKLNAKKALAYGTVLSQIEYYENTLANSKAELESLNQQLADAREKGNGLSAAILESRIKSTENKISSAQSRLEEQRAKKAAADAELAPLEQQLSAAKAELDKNSAAVTEGLASIAAARAQVADGGAGLRESRARYEKEKAVAEARFAAAEKELNEGKAQLDAAKAQLDDAKTQLDDAEKQIKNMNHADTYVLGRDTNIGYVLFENDTSIVDNVAGPFPIFFFLIAALVCLTTMTRMVSEQRTQIGIMKALGYGSGSIAAKYLLYSGIATLSGSIFGILVCAFGFPAIIWFGYGIMYSFSKLKFTVDWTLAIAVILLNLCVTLLVTWLSCMSELKSVPAELIRPKAPESGKRILLERLPFIWNKMSFMKKVSARNIFRYKKRMFMMLVGISGCTALLLTGFGLNDTIKSLVGNQFGEVCPYDCELTMAYDMNAEEQKIFLEQCSDKVADATFIYRGGWDVYSDGQTKSLTLSACNDGELDGFVNLRDGDERVAFPGTDEVVINRNIAESMDISIGDEVSFKNSDMQELTVSVSGIFDNYVENYAYISSDTLNKQISNPPQPKTVLLNFAEDADAHRAGAEVGSIDGVRSVNLSADAEDSINNMMSSVKYIILLVVGCAGLLAFIVIFNLTNININERIREIATIKVLGFYPNETARYVFRENLVLTGMGAAIGLALGKLLHSFIISKIKVDMMYFAPCVKWPSYLISVALTFVFAILVNMRMRRRIDNIDMAGALKSIE